MRFGSVNVPDSVLWIAGIVAPFACVAVYRHFRADPTDIVTDVLPNAAQSGLRVLYNSGPEDTLPVPTWGAGPIKAALVGVTRDRVRATLQQFPNLPKA